MPSTSKSQQRFMGLVRAVQEGKVNKNRVSKHLRETAEKMSPQDAHDFAATKRRGLPEHVKKSFELGFAKKAVEKGFTKEESDILLKKSFELPPWVMEKLVNPAMEHVVKPVREIPENFAGARQHHSDLQHSKLWNGALKPENSMYTNELGMKRLQDARNERLMRLAKGVGVAGAGVAGLGMGAHALMGGQTQQPQY